MASNKYHMLKAMIALSWTDGKQTDEERQLLAKLIDRNLHITDAERAQLKSEMGQPIDILSVWENIDDPLDRATVIDLALSMFNADKDYSESEQKVYQMLLQSHIASLDKKTVTHELTRMAAESKQRLEAEEKTYENEYLNDSVIYRNLPSKQPYSKSIYRLYKALKSH